METLVAVKMLVVVPWLDVDETVLAVNDTLFPVLLEALPGCEEPQLHLHRRCPIAQNHI